MVYCSSLLLIIAQLTIATNASANNACKIEGVITNVGAGEYHDTMPDGNNGTRESKIIFTEVTLQINKIIADTNQSCDIITNKLVGKYGLCEDINIYKGDNITANLAQWVYSVGCLSEITVHK